MAEDSDKKEDAGTPQADAFAVFDKVFELRWVVKICAVVLFAETALMLVKGASFYSFEWARANWVSETGNLVSPLARLNSPTLGRGKFPQAGQRPL